MFQLLSSADLNRSRRNRFELSPHAYVLGACNHWGLNRLEPISRKESQLRDFWYSPIRKNQKTLHLKDFSHHKF